MTDLRAHIPEIPVVPQPGTLFRDLLQLLVTGGTEHASTALVRQARAEPVCACFVAEWKGLNGRAQLGGLPTLSLVYDGA